MSRNKDINPDKFPSKTKSKFTQLRRYANSGWIYCLFMILILFCVRNSMLLSDMWARYDQADLIESMTVGNLAYDIIDGVWRGWNCYLGDTFAHTGWAVIPSCVALPLYFIFGPSLMTLCQVPILFSAAIACIIYHLCSKYFDRTTAYIAVAFYVFLPQRIQAWEIYPYCEPLAEPFFTLLGIGLFMKAFELYHQYPEKRKQWMFLTSVFGLTSGVAIFHCENYVFVLGTIVVVFMLHYRKFIFQKSFMIALLPAFLVGLIPYLVFSPLISLPRIIHWYTIRTAFIEAGREYNFWSQTLPRALASILWPVKLLSSGLLKGIPLLLVGSAIGFNIQRGFRYSRCQSNSTFVLNILRFFTFSYILFTICSLAKNEHYFYPTVPYLCILFAIAIRDLSCFLQKVKMPRLRLLVFFIVAFCCIYNCFGILRGMSPKTWGSELRKLSAIKGCNFYWPFGYWIPSGWKTAVTLQVESQSRIPEDVGLVNHDKFLNNPKTVIENGQKYTVDPWYLVDKKGRPCSVKMFAVSVDEMRYFVFLNRPESFLKYGMDITFTGLEKLAREAIHRGFPDKAKEQVYMSLAVHYNNDFWISYLLDSYENKDIEKVVPEPFRKYFYQEFGRRLRSQYGDDKAKADKIVASLSAEQKTEIMTGYDTAKYYYKAAAYERIAYATLGEPKSIHEDSEN